MQLITQPNRWNCVATSLAMVLRIPVEEVFRLAGHDGSEVPPEWFHLEEPLRRRGHSLQEMIDVCMQLGYTVTPIVFAEEFITSNHAAIVSFKKPMDNYNRFINYLEQADGLITGVTKLGARHCVAWDHMNQMVHDPKGLVYGLQSMYAIKPEAFYLVLKSNQKFELTK